MSASNFRIKEYDTVHHLVSRIAHKVFFLGEDERNDLIGMIRRAAAFGGVRLLGWCIMTNHFHLLVHLPVRVDIDDEEVLRRVGILKGAAGRAAMEAQIAAWRTAGDEVRIKAWFDRQRARMYDIGEFMKIVKQWFTEDYNRRRGHVGTLWESTYHDHVIPMLVKSMSHVLGYVHLNPIRAAACARYDDYRWSSFAALAKGDTVALEGVRFAYDAPDATAEELMARHEVLLDELLEGVKRQRAEEIARKRAAGFNMPLDPLTSEAMVAQAAAHLDVVQKASMGLNNESSSNVRKGRVRHAGTEVELLILSMLANDPMMNVDRIADSLSCKCSNVYARLRKMQTLGLISRVSRTSPWCVNSTIVK